MNSPRFYKNAACSSVLVALALTFATFTQAQTPKRAYLANLRARVRADIAAQPNERKPQDQYPQEDLEQMLRCQALVPTPQRQVLRRLQKALCTIGVFLEFHEVRPVSGYPRRRPSTVSTPAAV